MIKCVARLLSNWIYLWGVCESFLSEVRNFFNGYFIITWLFLVRIKVFMFLFYIFRVFFDGNKSIKKVAQK